MPFVAESMITSAALPRTRCLPLIVGYLSRPALSGKVFTTAPFWVTVMMCVAAFA